MSLDEDQKAYGNLDVKEGWLDLRLGNPMFLAEQWYNMLITNTHFTNNECMEYSKQRAEPWLEKEIRTLHTVIGNVRDIDSYSLVVGNGSSQVIMAAMMAYKKRGWSSVGAQTPYWPRFPVLTEYSGLTWESNTPRRDIVKIVTAPNNPNGSMGQILDHDGFGITDLNYNWPTYTDTVYNGGDQVMVYGLAKLTGHASTRVGWAFVKDSSLAHDMNYAIEVMTSGVSVDAQARAASLIKKMYNVPKYGPEKIPGPFYYAKVELKNRWARINEICSKSLAITTLSRNGMFLYAQDNTGKGLMDMAKVHSLAGNAFGETGNKFRVNIGCSTKDFNDFIERLKGVL
jgi:L-tryptophan--pyruvate aminotransferase